MPTKKKPRMKRASKPDWSQVALEIEPNQPGRRAVLTSLLEGAAAEVDRLSALGDELGATESRALCEHRRLVARLCGVLGTGQTARAVAPQQFADLPIFTDAEPEADDADIDAKLAQTFNAEVSDATDE